MRAALLLVCLASACATAAPTTASVPDTAAVRAAFMDVELLGCDELTCNYRSARRFEVRALRCGAEDDERDKARCTFERRLLSPHGRIAGPWHAAETSFIRVGQAWIVATDWTPDRD